MPTDLSVTLEGTSVRLEPLIAAHAPLLLAAADEDRSTYAFTHVPHDLPDMQSYVDARLAGRTDGTVMPFVVVLQDDDRVVGATTFQDIQWWPLPGDVGDRSSPSVVEIGSTWLAASVQRTSVNTECKLLLLAYAFEQWGVCRVSLQTDARNARSRAAIERIGGRFDGVLRAHKLGADGSVRDSAFFSIVAGEWPAVKSALEQRLGG